MGKTKIEWTDETWNPQKGCSRVSPGCDNCYAIGMAHRFKWGAGLTKLRNRRSFDGSIDKRPDWTGRVTFHPDVLAVPLTWRKPRRVFVCSGSDLFHESVDFEQIAAIFGVMAMAETSTFQVLTKRPKQARKFFKWYEGTSGAGASPLAAYYTALEHGHVPDCAPPIDEIEDVPWPLPNVWIGASVEDRERMKRIDELRQVPAAVRFLSIEPLLEDLGTDIDLSGIDWVIVGGEAGRGARPFETQWAVHVVANALAQDVACFVKQVGSKPIHNGHKLPLSDAKGGEPDDWPSSIRVRQWPPSSAA